jgi:hypothetical protein
VRTCALAAAILLGAAARAVACPCYSVSAVPNNGNCGVEAAPGTNPSVSEWQPIFTLVAGGPVAWGAAGPSVPAIGQGCGKPETLHDVPARFPCELLRAIAMQESSWTQFCVPTEPANQVGPPSRTIVSFDCGYGVGQVTSGMHVGETPAFDRARVASDATYNLATSTQILADKWRATNCVGDNQPAIVEDWYVATWAYNGLAFVNNPNNPNYDANRPVCDPQAGCAGRPYQERIWGWMEHPPTPQHWAPLAPAYPNRGDIGSSGVPPNLPEPACAGPTDCVGQRSVHTSACFAQPVDGGAPTDGAIGGDASAPGDDAGSTGGGPGGGCGCRVGGQAPAPLAGGVLIAALLSGVAARRRRAARSDL